MALVPQKSTEQSAGEHSDVEVIDSEVAAISRISGSTAVSADGAVDKEGADTAPPSGGDSWGDLDDILDRDSPTLQLHNSTVSANA